MMSSRFYLLWVCVLKDKGLKIRKNISVFMLLTRLMFLELKEIRTETASQLRSNRHLNTNRRVWKTLTARTGKNWAGFGLGGAKKNGTAILK